MDTLESEEEIEKKRKLEERCAGKSTRPREDAMFSRWEIIDALKRSDERMETYSKKQMKRWINLMKKWKGTRRKQR